MLKKFVGVSWAGLWLVFFLGGQCLAASSGVIRLEMPDAEALGMGSAFVGQADTPAAVYYNPAGMVQTQAALSVGATVVAPQFDYEPPSGDKVQMRRDVSAFPHVYFVTPIVQDKFYLGIGENSNYGMGSDWNRDTFNRWSCYKSKFENKDYMLVGAFKYNEQWSFAVGADNDDSTMEKYKKLSQYEQPDGDLKIKMKDSAWGFRLATMYKVNEKHQFGLMYRSPIRHEYEGRTYLNDLTDSGLGGPTYNTIFGGSSYETRVSTKFVLPQSIVLGYSFKPDAKWVINADLEWLDWSGVKEQSFDFPDEAPGAKLNVLNTGNPQNRDWTSVWSASLGAEYAVVPKLRLRGGYIFHQTPIGNDTFDTAFNDANSHSLTTGFGYDLSSRLTLDMAYAAVFFESRDINNSVDSVFGADLDGKYTTFVNVGTVTLTYKF